MQNHCSTPLLVSVLSQTGESAIIRARNIAFPREFIPRIEGTGRAPRPCRIVKQRGFKVKFTRQCASIFVFFLLEEFVREPHPIGTCLSADLEGMHALDRIALLGV